MERETAFTTTSHRQQVPPATHQEREQEEVAACATPPGQGLHCVRFFLEAACLAVTGASCILETEDALLGGFPQPPTWCKIWASRSKSTCRKRPS